MLIVCPSCASRYEIDPEKLGTGGRKVRCRGCSFQWFAHGDVVVDGETDGTPDSTASAIAASPLPADTAPAPVMRADQSAEAFVEQEWARAGETDQAVADAMSEQARLSAGETDDSPDAITASPTEEAPPSEPAVVDAIVAPATKPVKAPRRKMTFKPGWRFPEIVPASLSRSIFSPAAIVLGGTVILALLIMQRQAVVSRVPQMAGVFRAIGLPVNLQGLAFERVATELIEDTQGRFLIVQGEIRNVARGTLAVPPIEIIIQDATVKSLYTWTAEASRPTVIQGDSIPFRTRLASPPQNGSNVILRFAADRKTVQN